MAASSIAIGVPSIVARTNSPSTIGAGSRNTRSALVPAPLAMCTTSPSVGPRGQVRADVLSLARSGTQASLDFPADWSALHPRTLFLLHEEAQAWSRGGVLKLALRG